MSDLKVSVSKGKTVATLFDTAFPSLLYDGDRQDKLISFKTVTMAYVQANILMCATYLTPKEDLFERALSFQDSLEAGYKTDHATIDSDGTLHSDYRRELQVVLSQSLGQYLTVL